jgi:transcriptional regulator with XRE-family HTH domain
MFMDIGDVIASVRRRKRLERIAFAKSLKISASYLSQVENNRKKPSIKLLKAIARELNVPLSVLLFDTLEDKHFPDESSKELFKKIQPIMDDLVELFDSKDS